MHKNKSYIGFIILLLLVIFLLFSLFVNPNFIYKTEFNKSFESTESDINLDNNLQIVDYIEKRIINIPGDVLNLKQSGRINETQEIKIIETLDRASSDYSTYKSNYKEEDLYNSLFYAQASLAYLKSYPFIHCADEISKTAEKYKPFFYYLNHVDRKGVFDIIGTSERLNNYLEYNSHYRDDKINIIRKARQAFNIEQDFNFYELKCEKFKKYLEEDYKRQKLLIVFKILVVIAIFLLGFVVGFIAKNAKKIKKKTDSFSDKFSRFFFPQRVEDSTIERILKTNSILAIFGVFGTAFITSGNLLIKLLGFLAVIDVFIILSSIVFGISALNNKSQKGKEISYSLYSIGIMVFILLAVCFFIMFVLGNLVVVVKESLQTFLSNQTTIK